MPDLNAGDQIARNAERLREEAAKLGLTLRGYTFAPNFEGGPHMVQAVFTIDAIADEVDDAMDGLVGDLEAMLAGQRAAELPVKVEDAREVLKRRLEEDGGFLGES